MTSAVDLAPLARLLALACGLALLPLSYVWLKRQRGQVASRLALLTTVTLFLTFDLIVFGAFTRLTDSGLGCPDWPGCYGHASPVGASAPIAQAQAALPDGPVTVGKAWIEMIHRYLAMTVGALCLVMAVAGWTARRDLPHSPWWPTVTLVWVVVQGLFGKYTVTLKLYPAVVTLHLLGGLVLLALLAVQRESFGRRPLALPLPQRWRVPVLLALAVVVVQVALGGWVSTNYAVLACRGFPTCNGQWWPVADFASGFAFLRELGHTADGQLLPFDALVAIHLAHRAMAVLVTLVVSALGLALWRHGGPAQRWGRLLIALIVLQVGTGLSNVVLHWPLLAALLHSAGAAALVLAFTLLLARMRPTGMAPSLARRAVGVA